MATGLNRSPFALVVACAALAGCASEQPAPVVDVQAEVDDILVHFANPSESERWRSKLIDVAQRGPQQMRTVLQSMEREYMRSWRRGGGGASGLDNAGRRRTMEVTAELGDVPGTRDLLSKGLKDDEPNVVAAAAHALAKWGDSSGLKPLLKVAAKTEGPGREHARGALELLADPSAREAFLAGHVGDDVILYEPTLASFPAGPKARRKALQAVAEKHTNPHARTFAIQALSELGDAGELAKDALHNAATRGAALDALEQSGDAAALAAELETEPKDAVRVIKHLYAVHSAEAAEAAGRLLSGDLSAETRGLLIQEFFGTAGEKRPAIYASGAGHAAVLEALRGAIERESGQAQRESVVALGQLGDPAVDEGALLRLQGQDSRLDGALLEALGHLGGEAAGAHLMYTLESTPDLAAGAGAGLRALIDGGHAEAIAGAELIVLLDHEDESVREEALSVLQALAGDDDARGYKPSADADSRRSAVEAWQSWVDAR